MSAELRPISPYSEPPGSQIDPHITPVTQEDIYKEKRAHRISKRIIGLVSAGIVSTPFIISSIGGIHYKDREPLENRPISHELARDLSQYNDIIVGMHNAGNTSGGTRKAAEAGSEFIDVDVKNSDGIIFATHHKKQPVGFWTDMSVSVSSFSVEHFSLDVGNPDRTLEHNVFPEAKEYGMSVFIEPKRGASERTLDEIRRIGEESGVPYIIHTSDWNEADYLKEKYGNEEIVMYDILNKEDLDRFLQEQPEKQRKQVYLTNSLIDYIEELRDAGAEEVWSGTGSAINSSELAGKEVDGIMAFEDLSIPRAFNQGGVLEDGRLVVLEDKPFSYHKP